jgi:phosphoesterase RecJ-like protein
MTTLKEFVSKLKEFSSYAIVCHNRPDGDAIGSALALKFALLSVGKSADVLCQDKIPDKFSFVDGYNEFLTFPKNNYDAVVFVDCADETRSGELFNAFSDNKNTFNIDHHVSNTRYAKYNLVIDTASNCENIYAVINELGAEISTKIANALLLGISTDSGNFSHKNLTKSPFFVAGDLVDKGADINKIYNETYNKKSKGKAQLFASVCSNIKYYLEDRLGIVIITDELIEKCGAKKEDTEGIIDFVLSVDTVLVAISIMEFSKNVYKVSFRSKGVNVNEIASIYGGGGHVLASGCQIGGNIYEVIDKLIYSVKQRLD